MYELLNTQTHTSVGYYSTQGIGSNTPAAQIVTLVKEAITLLITQLRNSLLYPRSSGSNQNLVEKNRKNVELGFARNSRVLRVTDCQHWRSAKCG